VNTARYGLGSLLQGCGVPPLMLDATHGRTVQKSRWLTTPCVIPISRSRISRPISLVCWKCGASLAGMLPQLPGRPTCVPAVPSP
jgi:hypothetical protein